ncbi:phospho-N-acetylmuramoyl-pentapeptide-transferase [Okeania sp.]|uniref:phospho-N-acetylmuramoyl-pentapeptide- transferase n=1 Tax=Okeania sp. TaxID=3100323 RepID=UPI002B4B9187|nr:phospho-N-acetylmuramoyl-pentapeptide-transferase [Okeania sp.]MEB3340253.1 phospho-N-acetylmuramoyl-pentapeptide-transferase [Okeania sp.]
MENKLTLRNSISLSGQNLLLGLGVGLISFALILDGMANRVFAIKSLSLPLIICGLLTVSLGYWTIPILRNLKAGQIIREDGPQAHLKKAGTPTMGGIFFVPVGVAIALVLSRFSPDVVAVSLLTLAYGFIGWLDDWQILRRKSNKGISPRMKLVLQITFASLFCGWLAWSQPSTITNIALPFGLQLPLGLLFWPLAGFVLVAESNATNLTDGVDGLMGGLGAIAFFGLGAYLAPTSPELMIFCACMSGSCLGFVVHNRNPAKVFMGDTGSLALGGGLGAVGLLTNSLWVLFLISGVFLIETLSVIAQVSYYKATKGTDGVGKRLFKMAPFHHHLELSGWLETQVVGTFYLVTSILTGLCLLQ